MVWPTRLSRQGKKSMADEFDPAFQEIMKGLHSELKYQEERWGHEADDTKNTPNDWATYIAHYSTRWFPNDYVPYTQETVDSFRDHMLKTAAIAIAAVQSLDRQRDANGVAFYESTPMED